jgi:CheY-like chemotaxis protein/anti-sigma regulatory factor (Ser/Thr protein kinase)
MSVEIERVDSVEAGPSSGLLVVDADPADRELARQLLEAEGYEVAIAATGEEAISQLEKARPSVALIDLNLPDLDGLELIRAIRKDFPLTAVVLITHQGSDALAFKALKCGAASYVPKAQLASELSATMETVIGAAEVDRRRYRLMGSLVRSELSFSLGNDPTLIPSMTALFQENITGMGVCGPQGCIRVGIALEEALLNAIYHGNLEVSSELRMEGDEAFRALIEERRRKQPYAGRRVHVCAKFAREEATFIIRDEGPGFDPASLPDPTDPANLESTSGRGLLLIRTFMDHVAHNSAGNEITMTKRREAGCAPCPR